MERGNNILYELKRYEEEIIEKVFPKDKTLDREIFDEKYLGFLVSIGGFLPYLVSGLTVCIAKKYIPSEKEKLINSYFNASRLEEIIDFKNHFFFADKIKPEYEELEKINLFRKLTDNDIKKELHNLRHLRNMKAHGSLKTNTEKLQEILKIWNIPNPHEEIYEIVFQIKYKIETLIDHLFEIFENSELKTENEEPILKTEEGEINLAPLFIIKRKGMKLHLMTYTMIDKDMKCTFTDGNEEELIKSERIAEHIDIALRLETEEMNYIGEPIKIKAETFKRDRNSKKKYSLLLKLSNENGEIETKTVDLNGEEIHIDTENLEEGNYTIKGIVVESDRIEEYKKATSKEKRVLEKAYSQNPTRIEYKKEGKAEIEKIEPPDEILENNYGEYEVTLRNTGNTKINAEIIFEDYNIEYFSFKPENIHMKPYRIKTFKIKLKALRTEDRKYSPGMITVLSNGEKESLKQPKIKIAKNFEPVRFIDRKEFLEEISVELNKKIIKRGIHIKRISGEAGQGKTRLLRRVKEIAEDNGCRALTVEMQRGESPVTSFLSKLASEMERKFGRNTSYTVEMKKGMKNEEGKDTQEVTARYVKDVICTFADEMIDKKILIQIDDAHLIAEKSEGLEFLKHLMKEIMKENDGNKKETDIRIFFYTRMEKGLGYVDEDKLKPFEKINDKIYLVELKKGAKKEKEYENVNELVWGIVTEVFKPNEFDEIEEDLRKLLVKKSEGNPLILQLLLERYLHKGAIEWDENKWRVRMGTEELNELIPDSDKLKERLILDKLRTDDEEQQRIIHLVGMLGEISEEDIKKHKIEKRKIEKLENKLLKKTDRGYRFIHSLYEESWEKEIGKRAIKERKEVEEVIEKIERDYGGKKIGKLWKYFSLKDRKSTKEEKEKLQKELRETLEDIHDDGYTQDRLREINEIRKDTDCIAELSKRGWFERGNDFPSELRYGYWLINTAEKVEMNGKEINAKYDVIDYLSYIIAAVEEGNSVLYINEFIEDGEYLVEKILKESDDYLLKIGGKIPEAISTIANSIKNRGDYEVAEEYYKLSIEKLSKLIDGNDTDETLFNSKGNCLQRLAELHAGSGRTEDAENEYMEAIQNYDRAIKLNNNYAITYNNRGNCLQRLAELHAGSGRTEDTENEYMEAIQNFNRAIELNDNYTYAYNNRGNCLQRLAELHAKSGKTEDVENEYEGALESFDRAVTLSNTKVPSFLFFKGITHLKYSKLLFSVEKNEEGEEQIDEYISSFFNVCQLIE
jgi:tetratricopeptide (TPR) repeat protein